MTTTHPMIERAAQAAIADLFKGDGVHPNYICSPCDGASLYIDGEIDMRQVVIAVLRALREPDEGVLAPLHSASYLANGFGENDSLETWQEQP